MLVPVVFLMLPVVMLFALYPGLFTLNQGGTMPRLTRLLLGLKGERGDVPGWVLITAMTVALVCGQRGAARDRHPVPGRGAV